MFSAEKPNSLNQVAPAFTGEQPASEVRDKIQVIEEAKSLIKECQRLPTDSSMDFPSQPLEITEIENFQGIWNCQISPDGLFIAHVMGSILAVRDTFDWEIFYELNLEIEECSLGPSSFFFFPDSRHIGVTDHECLQVYSILKKKIVSTLYFRNFKQFGKVYDKGKPVTEPQKLEDLINAKQKYEFHHFFDLDGYLEAPIPIGCIREQPRPRMLAYGTETAIFLVDLFGYDYERLDDTKGYWMRPRACSDLFWPHKLYPFDNLGLISNDGNIRILRFNDRFFKLLKNTLEENTQISSNQDELVTNQEIEMIVHKLDDLRGSILPTQKPSYPGCQELLVWDNRQLIGINLYDPTKRKVYQLPDMPADVHHLGSLVAGKYLVIGTVQEQFFFYRKADSYNYLFKFRFKTDETPWLVNPFNKLYFLGDLVLQIVPVEFSPDILIKTMHPKTFLGCDFYKQYVNLPEHRITFYLDKSNSQLLYSVNDEPFNSIAGYFIGWSLSSSNTHLFLLDYKDDLFSFDLRTRELSDVTQKIAVGKPYRVRRLNPQYLIVELYEDVEKREHSGFWKIDLDTFAVTECDVLHALKERYVVGNYVLMVDKSGEDRIYELYDFDQNLVADVRFVKGVEVKYKQNQSGDGVLFWCHDKIYFVHHDRSVRQFKLDFSDLDKDFQVQISPDLQHIAVFCGSLGHLKIYDSNSMEVRWMSAGHQDDKEGDFDGVRQYFYFDAKHKYLFFLEGDNPQSIKVFSLEHYVLFATISIPAGFKSHKFWLTDDERFVVAFGAQVAPTDASSSGYAKYQYTMVRLQIPFGIDPDCGWGATRDCLMRMQEHKSNLKEKNTAIDSLVSVWESLPAGVRNQTSLLPWIVYAANDIRLLQGFIDRVIGTFDLALFHSLLEIFFSDALTPEMAQCIVDNFKKVCADQSVPTSVLKSLQSYFDSKKVKHLTADSLRRELTGLLLLKKSNTVLKGQLVSDQFAMAALGDSPSVKNDQAAVDPLLERNPDSLDTFSVYETRFQLDLSNGSEFSCALFDFICTLPDDQLKTVFRPIIYYKWAVVYKFALFYFGMVLTNNVLAYIYLGYLHEVLTLGIINIVTAALLILFDLKTLVSSPKVYSSSIWNFYDLSIYIFNIVAVIYNFSSSEEDRLGRRSNVWLRFLPVILLGVRSITWLRVFSATRYMVTMVIEVFSEIAAFLVMLASVLMIYAYAWRLAGGLKDGFTEEPQTDFYSSVLSAVNLIFGNAPDPLGEEGTPFDLIVFVVYIFGNVTLALVLLNFLIALISGTYERVSSDKELYDAKELLPLIRDFDLFLKGRKETRNDETQKQRRRTKAFFALLVKEETGNSEIQEVRSEIQEIKQEMKQEMKSEIQEIKSEIKEMKSLMEESSKNLENRSKQLEDRFSEEISSMKVDHSKVFGLLSQIAEKLPKQTQE